MNVLGGLVGGFLLGVLIYFVGAFALIGRMGDLGPTGLLAWVAIALGGSTIFGFVLGIKTPRAAKVWRRIFLIAGVVCLIAPLSTCVGTATLVTKASDVGGGAAVAGAAIGSGIASMVVGFFAFFLAAIFLVLGFAIGRDKKQPTQ